MSRRLRCIFASMAALSALTACGHVDRPPKPAGDTSGASGTITGFEASMFVDDLLERTMRAYGAASSAMQPGATGIVTINQPVDMTENGSLAGKFVFTGTVTGTMDATTGATSLALDVKEAITGVQFEASGITYTVDGDSDVVATGTFVTANKSTPPKSHTTIKGTFTIARSGETRKCPFTADFDFPGDADGKMKATICGEAVHRTM